MIKRGINSLLLSKSVKPSLRMFGSGTKFEKFNFEDPLCLEELLTEEEKMVRDSARAYAQDKLMPRIRKAYNDEKFDVEIMKEMGQ